MLYRITHITAFVIPVVEHWLNQEIAQWAILVNDRSDDPLHHEQMLYRITHTIAFVIPVIEHWLKK